jgi:hypothetical protein
MPLSHEVNTEAPRSGAVCNYHQIKVNQTLIKDLVELCLSLKKEIVELRKDIDKNSERINYIYDYTVKKKEKDDGKWF